MKAHLLVAALTCLATLLEGQTQPKPARKFEVSAIKPNNSGPPTAYVNPFSYSPSGRFTATNVTLVDVIVNSVRQTRRIQMRGGPDWIDRDRFNISANADLADGPIKNEEWAPMIQALLEDRFKLALHRETRETSVYALVAGKDAPKLAAAKDDETAIVTRGDRGQFTFHKMPIVAFVNTLANILQEPVVDGTGLTGLFNIELDPMKFAANGAQPNGESYAALVLTAVQDQLGLKLEKRKAPLEITIVDHAEKPGEN